MNFGSPAFGADGSANGLFAATLAPIMPSRASRVFSAALASSSSVGSRSASVSPSLAFMSSKLVYTASLSRFVPCFTIASYFTSPSAPTSTATIALLVAEGFLLGFPMFSGYLKRAAGDSEIRPSVFVCR